MKVRTCALVLAVVVALVGVPDLGRLRSGPPAVPGPAAPWLAVPQPSITSLAATLVIRSAVDIMVDDRVTR